MLYIDLYYRNTIVLVYDWCRDKRTPFICNNKGTVRKSSVDELEIFKAQEINVILGRPYKCEEQTFVFDEEILNRNQPKF